MWMININSSNTHVADNQEQGKYTSILKKWLFLDVIAKFLITYKQPLTYLENKFAI